MPRRYDSVAEAILINTAGGLTGGDMLGVSIKAHRDARVLMTTQASEKVYRSLGDTAQVNTNINVGHGARFDWLPQETILFDHARLRRRYAIDLAERATFLAVESVVFGRSAMGETVRAGAFHDRWRIKRQGRLIYADDIRMDGVIGDLITHRASLAGGVAMATIIYCGTDGDCLIDPLRAAIGDAGGASWFDGKLLARLVADEGFTLRQTLIPAIATLRGGAELPKSWQQ
jgi:urease accessory protein